MKSIDMLRRKTKTIGNRIEFYSRVRFPFGHRVAGSDGVPAGVLTACLIWDDSVLTPSSEMRILETGVVWPSSIEGMAVLGCVIWVPLSMGETCSGDTI